MDIYDRLPRREVLKRPHLKDADYRVAIENAGNGYDPFFSLEMRTSVRCQWRRKDAYSASVADHWHPGRVCGRSLVGQRASVNQNARELFQKTATNVDETRTRFNQYNWRLFRLNIYYPTLYKSDISNQSQVSLYPSIW